YCVVPQHLEVHHCQCVTMIVIGDHFAGHIIPLPFLNSSNDGGTELPVGVRILADGIAKRFVEVLRNIPRTVLPRAGIGVRNAARDADNSATGSPVGTSAAGTLSASSEPRADATGVGGARAPYRFPNISSEVAYDRSLINNTGGQTLRLG